jgi:predicted phosphodiesterase
VQVNNIGVLHDKVLVFGGVYSNLQALEKMMEVANDLGIAPGNIICTGDVVGYCAEPEAVVQKIKTWGIHCIAGNVELQLRDGEEDCGCDFNEDSRCDIFSRQWYPFAQSALSTEAIQWMHQLPHHLEFQYAGLKGRVVHGSTTEVSGYVFASTPWEEKVKHLALANVDFILGGHCGLPFSQQNEEKYWLNPGVIGMPANDGTTRVWYMLLDDTNGFNFEHHSFEYDHTTAAAQMRAHKLPAAYALTLETGLWDNCEILPPAETAAQGQRISFS